MLYPAIAKSNEVRRRQSRGTTDIVQLSDWRVQSTKAELSGTDDMFLVPGDCHLRSLAHCAVRFASKSALHFVLASLGKKATEFVCCLLPEK